MLDLNEVLEQYAIDVVKYSKLNLSANSAKWGIRATWAGKRGQEQPKSFKRKQRRGNSIATGNLKRSLKYSIDEESVNFTMPQYGYYVNFGRRGKKDVFGIGSKPSSKAPPRGSFGWTMDKWILDRGLRPRNTTTGEYLPNTKENLSAMSYQMSRKVKWFGIAPTRFFTDAADFAYEKNELDILNKLSEQIIFD